MKKKEKKSELSCLFFFLLGAIFGYLVSAPARYEADSPLDKIGVTAKTNTGTVIPNVSTVEMTSKVGNIIRYVTNEAAVTQIVYVYRELSNFVTAAPVATGQSLETLTFDVYKNHYTLPLDFPRWTFGAGVSLPLDKLGVTGFSIYAGYRFYDRFGAWIGSDFKGIQIGLNVLID